MGVADNWGPRRSAPGAVLPGDGRALGLAPAARGQPLVIRPTGFLGRQSDKQLNSLSAAVWGTRGWQLGSTITEITRWFNTLGQNVLLLGSRIKALSKQKSYPIKNDRNHLVSPLVPHASFVALHLQFL